MERKSTGGQRKADTTVISCEQKKPSESQDKELVKKHTKIMKKGVKSNGITES